MLHFALEMAVLSGFWWKKGLKTIEAKVAHPKAYTYITLDEGII